MPDIQLKLGKKPASYDHRDLLLSSYIHLPSLPPIPDDFGHENLIGDWGMLGNDMAGDCVLAGGDHETMLWNKEAGKNVTFTTENALSDYSALTGYNPNDPNTDQGTDMRQAMSYRVNTGLVDAQGNRHKIGAYVSLEPGNWEHLLACAYLFGAAAVGIEFPSYAMDQFNHGKVWTARRTEHIEGGHYIPVIACRHRHPICVTWGREQPMTRRFYEKHCDEAFVPLSEEFLTSGKSPEGFDLEALNADLEALRS